MTDSPGWGGGLGVEGLKGLGAWGFRALGVQAVGFRGLGCRLLVV